MEYWCMEGLCFFILVVILVTVYFYARHREKLTWNNGISKYDDTPWVQFDTDSQGGRGYKDKSGNSIWISYRGVDSK